MDMGGIKTLGAIGLSQGMACEFKVCLDGTKVDDDPAWV